MVLFYVWGHTAANGSIKVREMSFNHWTQRFERIDRARISGMDWFEESAHANGTGFLVMVLVLVFVQAGSIRLG